VVFRKLFCLFGCHETTSYAEAVNFEGKSLVAICDRMGGNNVDNFLEMAAIRCKHCGYTYKSKTDTDWSLCDGL